MLINFKNKLIKYIFLCIIPVFLFSPCTVSAGAYLESAHGDVNHGVDRSSLDADYALFARGNCAHCHEMHASLQGSEPSPVTGAASHALFAPNFNSNQTTNPYAAADNFCFYCHGNEAGPQVVNQDYSAAFGGAGIGTGPQSIMEAFNSLSYHNLYDIRNFLISDPNLSPWFADMGNPCSACHNSHLAKRNWDNNQPGFPLVSAISKPGSNGTLWGETEVMAAYFSYEAPFAFGENREPDGVGDPDGTNTPDYPGFCMACHNSDNAMWSTSLNREIRKINWETTGLYQDKHGTLARDGTNHLREPYATASTLKSNFVLSCMDCHESHGSQNVMLLRRRINSEDLENVILSTDTMSSACMRCHQDDLAIGSGTGEAGRWEFVHHLSADAPYPQSSCGGCHGPGGGSSPIACGNCHGHGLDDSWINNGTLRTGRKTF